MDVHRVASVEEFGACQAVIADAWRAAFDHIVTAEVLDRMAAQPDSPELGERYEELDDAKGVALFAGTIEGRVIGTATSVWDADRSKSFVGDHDAELRTLYIHPDHWGHGHGSELLSVVESALPGDRRRLVLETFEANDMGRGFYESNGFVLVDEHTFEIGERAYPTVVYAKIIDS